MVADRVELLTRKAGERRRHPVGVERRGHLHDRGRADDAPQGTAVTLHLKPEDTDDELHDYTDPAEDPRDRQALLGLHHLADPDGAEPGGEGEAPRGRSTP